MQPIEEVILRPNMKLLIDDNSIEETIENSKTQNSKQSASRDDVIMKSIL